MFMQSRYLVAVAALAFALTIAPAAIATPTDHGSFTDTETFVDDGASSACGFAVTASNQTSGHFQVFYDSTGNPTRIRVEEDVHGTFTANGSTVQTVGHSVTTFGLVDGTETDAGLIIRSSLPGGGVLSSDRGRLVFDSSGNLEFEGGPHPSLQGDFSALCAALA